MAAVKLLLLRLSINTRALSAKRFQTLSDKWSAKTRVSPIVRLCRSLARLGSNSVRCGEKIWAGSYPVIAKSWRANWSRVVPMFGYLSEIRRVVYTTNTIESLNMTLRKLTKNRSLFPNDEAVFKLMYLGLRNISQRWTMPIKNWSGAMNQFAILFEGRVPIAGLAANSLTQNPA